MNDFTQIASHTPTPAAPNTFCAQPSCQATCEANPACQFYTGGTLLYQRDSDGPAPPPGPGPGPGPPPRTVCATGPSI